MHFIPLTKEQEQQMLDKMGKKSFNDLIDIIPPNLRYNNSMDIGDPLSEIEITNELNYLNNSNKSDSICFLGNGIYDHFIPTVVDFISGRSEFYTAYTPYQAEVSQGTLQYLYEFQSMICALSGMDISNASLYDGASALAEACNIAVSFSKKTTILYSSLINDNYIQVLKTYFNGRNIKFIKLDSIDGKTDLSIINKYSDDLACLLIQSPNKYGLIESWELAKNKISSTKGLLIAISDPLSLSLIKSPGEVGADLYVGEAQSLGNYMQYGGPIIGVIATKEKYKRKMPGRIIGKTIDSKNNSGYVLTLQTREQHIRRAKATSNICTNQGLLALRSTIYMSLMGKFGLPYVAKLCYQKSQYAASEIIKLKNYKLKYSTLFLKEFIIQTNYSASDLVNYCASNDIYINTVCDDDSDSLIQIAVTEKRTKEDIGKLIKVLKDYK